jgi:hypothetical protein
MNTGAAPSGFLTGLVLAVLLFRFWSPAADALGFEPRGTAAAWEARATAARDRLSEIERCAVRWTPTSVEPLRALGLSVAADGCMGLDAVAPAMTAMSQEIAERDRLVATLSAELGKYERDRLVTACGTVAVSALVGAFGPGLTDCLMGLFSGR